MSKKREGKKITPRIILILFLKNVI